MRDICSNLRDLALIDILSSTGMRVGELILLNKADVNFVERECKILGKVIKTELYTLMQEKNSSPRIFRV